MKKVLFVVLGIALLSSCDDPSSFEGLTKGTKKAILFVEQTEIAGVKIDSIDAFYRENEKGGYSFFYEKKLLSFDIWRYPIKTIKFSTENKEFELYDQKIQIQTRKDGKGEEYTFISILP